MEANAANHLFGALVDRYKRDRSRIVELGRRAVSVAEILDRRENRSRRSSGEILSKNARTGLRPAGEPGEQKPPVARKHNRRSHSLGYGRTASAVPTSLNFGVTCHGRGHRSKNSGFVGDAG
jgi:hypothetical protein